MQKVGEKLRKLREEKGMSLSFVADIINIDVAILSKMERGEKQFTKEIVQKLAKVYNHDLEDLMVLYLSEKVIYEVGNDSLAIKALRVAEEQLEYKSAKNMNRKAILKTITDFFKKDGRVSKAWIFGSFARNENIQGSDIDIMIKYSAKASGTLLDYADIQYNLQNLTHKKIDLAEEGYIKPFAWKNIQKDLIQIYG